MDDDFSSVEIKVKIQGKDPLYAAFRISELHSKNLDVGLLEQSMLVLLQKIKEKFNEATT